MGVMGSTSDGGTVTLEASEQTKITWVDLAVADTEVAHVLSTNVKQVMIRPLLASFADTIKYAFTVTESGTKYVPIYPRCSESLAGLRLAGSTLYLQSATIGTVVVFELF